MYLFRIFQSIVSSYFITVPQENTRVIVQSEIVTKIREIFDVKNSIITKAIQIEAFWLN